MGQIFKINPDNPQRHLLQQAADILHQGGIIVYPTDSSYALACQLENKSALERIRQIRQLDRKHYFTLICRDLSELSTYAQMDNSSFRFIKAYSPGPFTFILLATSEVPRRLQHPNRKTIGIRIPSNTIAQTLLEFFDEPLMSTSLILPGYDLPLIEPEAIKDLLGKRVDLIIDGGYCGAEPTTLIDLVESQPKILRQGKGEVRTLLI